MANPTLYSSPRQYVGLAVEVTQGTAVVPATTIPVDKFDPFDQPNWIPDNALRGSVTEPYFYTQGVKRGESAIGGPAYFDTIGYLLSNVFGDLVYSGTYTGSGTTTMSSPSVVGDTTVSVAASTGSVLVQIDTGNLSEVRTITSVTGAGPFVLHFTGGLVNAHAGATVVKPITGPYSTQFSTLNTGTAQPSSLTFTDYQGPTASTGTRAYPGSCLSALNLTGTVASSTMMYDGTITSWPSASAAAFTSSPSTEGPQPAWEMQVGLVGTVAGAPILTINDFSLALARVIQPYYTAQNSQNPYFIERGKLTAAGKLNFVVADETPLTYLNSNTEPQLQVIVSNGGATTALRKLQIDIQQCAFSTSKIQRGNAAVEYAVEFIAVANTTNAGYSGGYSPLSITLTNNTTPLSY